ncbi:MAG: BolA protein [Glaciecola sp.]|jgi:BolA protein|uniref:BolA family protein n=1 Tax=Congregibacter sp. TaxID=2744308 RepID=UPI0039E3AB29
MSVQDQLQARLNAAFAPDWLDLDNESHKHSVPANSETHFRLVMVSPLFEGKRAVARHQLVYGELADLLAGPIHALAMHLYDSREWSEKTSEAPASPECLGGSKADGGGLS